MWGITHLNEVYNTATPYLYFLRNHVPGLKLTGTVFFTIFTRPEYTLLDKKHICVGYIEVVNRLQEP